MARWIVAGLVVLNLLLGMGIYLRLGGERTAQAQIGAANGDVAAIAGNNGQTTIIYVLQASTGKLAAIRYDPVVRRTDVIAKVDVTRALQSIP